MDGDTEEEEEEDVERRTATAVEGECFVVSFRPLSKKSVMAGSSKSLSLSIQTTQQKKRPWRGGGVVGSQQERNKPELSTVVASFSFRRLIWTDLERHRIQKNVGNKNVLSG